MCILYLIYNMLSIPVHTFHVFTAVSSIADEVTGRITQVTEPLYYVIAIAIIVVIAVIAFGGIKSVAKFSDAIVPIMAGVLYNDCVSINCIEFRKNTGIYISGICRGI